MLRRFLIGLALAFLGLMVLLPVLAIFTRAFADGAAAYIAAIIEPETLAAIRLTVVAAVIVVPLNIVFGTAAAWLVARYRFWGRRALLILIELPFAMSPIVVGLCFLLIYGAYGPVGAALEPYGIQLMFNLTGIVLVSLFITCPFVMREILPVLMVTGEDEEKAALTLGANGWQIFRHVVLPNISWGLAYGTMLTMARAMGEFGAVSVVSGAIRGRTMTLPLQIELLYNDYNATGAFAAATVLTALALVTLIIRGLLNRFGPAREVHP
ncbi:MAG TPA: sulfate ABC transporter permease subunit CysW [Paracoccus sp. (in: a-proteobacteria)]|uniref:sulfate ABC transporter permease subunit CysW n=1 Tax=uncultured Paracoccus sp. TaxID=189685 RepID=UPI0026216E92|nr:sulfate ABC transporter permease subunit CysW [uncultured Paracoccus sp.]HMQ42134.1 sulfate ABC transporter permease subunit CysW [Paracoccus sp. (in: a-proteobacteria)]HMR37083.1 sulfate ABC transporter permease subunit CysW [Paracoccus sp. (in: a-proteobacteria)]